ncbi:MAG TPA: biotin/lipoyl-binding protein, partial [bacterium]|nr:biotin/lipoyl-binding protein [bacterium]
MQKKIISIISIIILLGVVIGFWLYKKNGQSPFIFAKVSKGTVFQRVSETGEVEVPKEKKLGFKVSGKIAKIFVKEGEEVRKGQKLAELENKDLFLQLEEAKAVLDLKQANYEKLITGAKKEEIKVKESSVLEAQTEFEKAQQNLKDVLAENQQKLDSVYKKALCILDEAHLAIYNSYNTIVELQNEYFPPSNGYSMQVIEEKDKIKNNLRRGGKLIEKAKNSESYQDIDKALTQLKEYLQDTNLSLTTVRDIVNNNIYRDMVSDTYKSSLDERKTSVVSAFRKVVDVIQEISKTKTENESKENNAKAEVSRTKARLEKAKDELSLIKSKARKEDIDS